MTYAPPVDPMTLDEVRAEMEVLAARKNERGGFHPAEYWRWRHLRQVEQSLLGMEIRPA